MAKKSHHSSILWPEFADCAMDLLAPIGQFFKDANAIHAGSRGESFALENGKTKRLVSLDVRRTSMSAQTDRLDTRRMDVRLFVGYGVYGSVGTPVVVGSLRQELQDKVEQILCSRVPRDSGTSLRVEFQDGSLEIKASGNAQGWTLHASLMISHCALARVVAARHAHSL
ncbi:hypothetical protein D3M70_30780 [Pseudomonas sp. LS-2]|nr:hypothetical protein D3M70_30780 [Pseudomonas sp. LS-2]